MEDNIQVKLILRIKNKTLYSAIQDKYGTISSCATTLAPLLNIQRQSCIGLLVNLVNMRHLPSIRTITVLRHLFGAQELFPQNIKDITTALQDKPRQIDITERFTKVPLFELDKAALPYIPQPVLDIEEKVERENFSGKVSKLLEKGITTLHCKRKEYEKRPDHIKCLNRDCKGCKFATVFVRKFLTDKEWFILKNFFGLDGAKPRTAEVLARALHTTSTTVSNIQQRIRKRLFDNPSFRAFVRDYYEDKTLDPYFNPYFVKQPKVVYNRL